MGPNAWFLDDECRRHADCWRELGVDNDLSVTRELPDRRGDVVVDAAWGWHRRGRDGFDPHFEVHGLDYAVEHPTSERSLVVWDLLVKLNVPMRGIVEKSTRQDYSNATLEEEVSPVGELTASHAWLPHRDGSWRIPAELSLDELDPNFPHDEALARRLGMRPTVGREIAEYLDIDADDLEPLRRHPDLIREAVESARRLMKAPVDEESQAVMENDVREDEEARDAEDVDVVEAFRAAFDRPGRVEVEGAFGDGSATNPTRRRERAFNALREAKAAEPPQDDRWLVVPRKEWEARDLLLDPEAKPHRLAWVGHSAPA